MRPAAPTTVVLVSEDSRRRRVAAVILAVVLVGLCVSGLTTFGFSPITGAFRGGTATQSPTESPGPTGAVLADEPDGTLEAHWDGPAVHLDWSGGTYTAVADSFVGQRTVVPGDLVRRTLQVTNDGPGDGILSVWVDPDTVVPAAAANPALSGAVQLEWAVADTRGAATFASLLTQDRTRVVQLHVPRGGTVPVTFGFSMPATTTDHARDAAPSTQLSFDVSLSMSGDRADPFSSQTLAATGAEVAHLALLAALALVTGALLWWVGRRRRCTRCGKPLRRSRTGPSRRVCPRCGPVPSPRSPGGQEPVPLDWCSPGADQPSMGRSES